MCQSPFRLTLVAILITAGLATAPRAQAPSTDIWLATLRVGDGKTGSIRVGEPKNVTRHAGYDNQPRFLPDASGFLYVQGDSDRTEVYRYQSASGRSTRVTYTPESEYSPTPIAGRNAGFYAVRVESDSTQRLWRFESDGSKPRLFLAAVDSVGYFALLDDRTLALFVVGEPHTLRIVDLDTERETVVASDIGRALLRTPRAGLTFLLHEPGTDPPTYEFHTWSEHGILPTRLIAAHGAGQDAAWIGDVLVMADGATLWSARPFDRSEWTLLADLGTYGLTGITRIAVSHDRKWIAIVAAESP